MIQFAASENAFIPLFYSNELKLERFSPAIVGRYVVVAESLPRNGHMAADDGASESGKHWKA